ncbi:MAG: DAK2 domain-containing protein [Chloroflexota bacterium]
MKQVSEIDGQDLRETFAAATDWLEKSAADINALNVFPVPDGDCGTNMLMTMRSSLEEASRLTDHTAAAVAQAMAKGALMGARGNSGVILSQIWRGLAGSLANKETIDGGDLAEALYRASETAYHGLSNPVEGTIITVARDAALAARQRASANHADVTAVLEAAVAAARESVANTPSLLPLLKEAGVVDAGGHGWYTLLEGALLYLRGEVATMQSGKSAVISSGLVAAVSPEPISPEDEVPFGYCTEFLIKGEKLAPEAIREELKDRGLSLIMVGDESTVRVHIHVLEPGAIVQYAASLGTLHNISIRNMDEQHQDFLRLKQERDAPPLNTAIVVVVNGPGLAQLFTNLGVTSVVPGGQTMNPSTRDILQAVEAAPSEQVIILPNNKNIVLTAQQVGSLTSKRVAVVPTETVPQGVAALIAFDEQADLETNTAMMTEARATVRTLEITRATRSTCLNGLDIREGQAIGLLDDRLMVAGDNPARVVMELLAKVDLAEAEVATVYYGADTGVAEARQVSADIQQRYPSLEVEVVKGGQPNYDYIISVE